MTNRNPYENDVDIPDFVEKKDDDIDMSYFKMTEDEINKAEFDDDDDYDDEPRRKLSPKGIMIIAIVVGVLLILAAVSGWIFGVSQKNAYTQLQAEYEALEENYTTANTTIADLKVEINTLNEKLATQETTTATTSSEETETSGDKYKFAEGIGVRKEAGSTTGFASFDKLSSTVQDAVYENGDEVRTRANAIIEVYSTKEVDGATWGKVADNAWICIKSKTGEEYATKQ